MRLTSSCLAVLLSALTAHAAAHLSVSAPQLTPEQGGQRFVQRVTLANDVCLYTLTYDIIKDADRPAEARSHWWAWTTEQVTLGKTEPSDCNWYFQAFFNWRFDEESLHKRPATLRVIHEGGDDAMVEYTWDTPKVTAHIRFALTDGSDKLLMFCAYEPKSPVKQSWMTLTCYPTGFAQPRNRAVTTSQRTVPAGGSVQLDLAREHWVLYEDTTAGRPGAGSAGLTVGTPESFAGVTVPVGDYGIVTRLDLKPEARSFALGLYDFPSLPAYEATRAYYRAGGDAEAAALGAMKPWSDQALPRLAMSGARAAALAGRARQLFERPAERFTPLPPAGPWPRQLPGGPLKTVLFVPRWAAYEPMLLAGRLAMKVHSLYFDDPGHLSNAEMWPYSGQTGVGPLGYGVAVSRAGDLARQPDTELYLMAGVRAGAVPPLALKSILDGVRGGKGLFLTGRPGVVDGWPKELFAAPDKDLAAAVLAAIPWEQVAGFRRGERGRVGEAAPLTAYRLGAGRVVVLRANLGEYSSLVPLNDSIDGQATALDRALVLAVKAALAAAGRPAVARIVWQAAADGRVLTAQAEPPVPGAKLVLQQRLLVAEETEVRPTSLALPAKVDLPAGHGPLAVDAVLVDAAGQALDWRSLDLPAASSVTVQFAPLQPPPADPLKPPVVALPSGGALPVRATVAGAPPGAQARWQVLDNHDRLLADERTPVAASGAVAATLKLARPVDVPHRLRLTVTAGERVLGVAQQRFTIPLPYAYDDFTGLVWTYPGGEPVLQATTRLCYQQGAALQDLCHMHGQAPAILAREYAVAAESGLRLVPYIAWLGGKGDPQGYRTPSLFDERYLAGTIAEVKASAEHAAPYAPVAYTLGDENVLNNSSFECCQRPETMVHYRRWLAAKYPTIAALNAAWATQYTGFDAITSVPWRKDMVGRTASFAEWLDHQRFMDTAFAGHHDELAAVARGVQPGAKVGWDGFNGYSWRAGYDFEQLTRNCNLNETYSTEWVQGELVRSFKQPGALVGKWGNAVADSEGGFNAHVWDGLLCGDNSVWWWTSWGCDYIPFNPDLSPTPYAKGFFEGLRETGSGPGKLLLHARRQHSGIGVLYDQTDLFAAALFEELKLDPSFGSDYAYLGEHQALLRGLHDLGCEYRHLTWGQIAAGALRPEEFKLFCLTLPTCVSDDQAAALRKYVEAGGTLLVDGRAGLLTGDGAIRSTRALDDLLGVRTPAGVAAVKAAPKAGPAKFDGMLGGQTVKLTHGGLAACEPGLETTTGQALGQIGGVPAGIVRTVGQGRTVLLNFGLQRLTDERLTAARPVLDLLGQVVTAAGVKPPAVLVRTDGSRPLATRLVEFTEGGARYLGVQQDLLLPGLAPQTARVKLPAPCWVYDVRARRAVGQVADWEVQLDRNRPALFALLPYPVRGLQVALAQATVGETIEVPVTVQTGATAGYHVVRLDVYPPGATAPHRQYSQNVACSGGAGRASIGLALNDSSGRWRLVWRDAATGVTAESALVVRGR